jgi:DNA-binding Xre family transcriptional regulator
MKAMRNNVLELLAKKARQDGRTRIPLRAAAEEMEISYYTLDAIVKNRIKEIPVEVLGRMCDYFGCNVGDILSWEEVNNAA